MSESYYRHMREKGHVRSLPLGSEREKKGYVRIKTAQPNVWKYKQVFVWEQANGRLPEGHVVIFADKNTRNFALENLIAVSRKELLVMNRRGFIYKDRELTKAGNLLAKLSIIIRKRAHGG